MKRTLTILAAAILPLPTKAQSAEAVLDRAVAVYSQMRSVRAEFTQTLTNPLTGTTASTTGMLLRRKPNLLSISFDNGDRIVADGMSLWLYVPSSVPGQVIRSSGAAASTATFDPAGELLNAPRTRYSVSGGGSSAVNGRASHVVSLAPKSSSVPFTKVKLWVDDADNSVRRFEVTDRNGLTRLVVINRLTMNPALSRRSFRFTPPKGVRVVEQPLPRLD